MAKPLSKRQEWIAFGSVFGVFVLVALAAVASLCGVLPNAPDKFKEWSWAVLATDVVAAVLVVFKAQFAPREIDVFLNLAFSGRNASDIEIKSCTYQIRDGANKVCQEGEAAVYRQPGGWQCKLRLTEGASAAEFAKLTLVCEDGNELKVSNFSLMTRTVEVQ